MPASMMMLTALAALVGTNLSPDPIPLQPGRFEITLTMTMSGSSNASTRTRCILPADLADPELVFTQQNARLVPKTWAVSALKVVGGKISYVVTPKDGPAATVIGTVSAGAFSVERTVKGFPAVSKIEGKRVGNCKA